MVAVRGQRSVLGVLAIAAAAVAYAAPVSDLGWNQGAHYALVEALDRGTPRIDRWRWQTGDVSWLGGHYYAAKAPGLAAASVPVYALLEASGVTRAISKRTPTQWKAARVTIWALSVWAVVLPAAILLLLVRRMADRVEPGLGTASALTLGFATLLLPFSTVFFSHVLAALLGFAAFALLWVEGKRAARLPAVVIAGFLAGLAVTVEFALAIVVVVVGVYAVAGGRERVRRGLSYLGGVAMGVMPLLLYNWWAFGSAGHLSYAGVVSKSGRSGHDVLGANASGFFGVGLPSFRTGASLLFASRGLLTLTPVVAMGVVGISILYRRGRRAEALVMGGVAFAFLTFNAGYFLPFGGWTAGPRFLIPALPFLGVPLAASYRRFPGCTLALAVVSAVLLVVATATQPLLPDGNTGRWASDLLAGRFADTFATLAGAGSGWIAILVFAVPAAVAITFGALATVLPPLEPREVHRATVAVMAWALAACVLPRLWQAPSSGTIALVVCAAAIGLLVVWAVAAATMHSERIDARVPPARA